MNEKLVQYRDKASQHWKQLSRNQQYMVLGTIAILLAVVILTSIQLSKTEFATAFRNLQPNDAANIKAYLDEAKIPYELSADGSMIAVPASQAASVKLDVEGQGLNQNGSLGYGAFEGSNTFGMSDNEFNVKLINAMQGEIQQMFNRINGISSSKVLITVPKETAFVTTQPQESTASVILNIENGYRYDQAQIDTMYNLVAKTVPKLSYENITISNQKGEALLYSKANGATTSASGIIQQQFQVRSQFQNELQRNIMNLLGTMYAPGKVVVSVFPTLNFDQKTSRENLVTPVNVADTRGIEISLQETFRSSTSGPGGTAAGVPGTGPTDIPNYPGTQATATQSETEESDRIVNFEVNRITNEIISSPFTVKDLSISVGIEPPVKDDPESLTQEMKDNIQRTLVSIVSATLADSGQTFTQEELERKVTLFAQPFAQTAATAPVELNYWMWGGIGVAAMLAAGAAGYLIRRGSKRRQELAEEMDAPTEIEMPTVDIETVSNENQVRKQLEGLAKRKPEEFVNLLRTWLVDE